jgi:hypothetical protein
MTTEKILDKLSKLKAARDGEAAIGNAAAAEAFAEAINRLLLQHELSEVDIPTPGTKEEPIVEVYVGIKELREHGLKYGRVRIGWQEALARRVARAHLCFFLVHRGSNAITFVGTEAHARTAEYAYLVLASAANRMSVKARNDYWRDNRDDPDFESGNFRAAWLQGFIERIGERFDEARKREVAATSSTSTALVRLNNALTRVKQHVDEKYKGKTPGARMQSGISHGRLEGRKAADAMKIGQRGVGDAPRKSLA